MSEKQPEGLRLAQLIQDGCPMDEAELVDELRRLHAENAELRKDADRLTEELRRAKNALNATTSHIAGVALSKSKEQA